MPRINKVRLIHFAWGRRRIDDLLLNFHGGQNAEIRLENGGGKSVLERLIYQAVWPGAAISKNAVSDYLTDKPAAVAIEWLLDTPKSEAADILTSGVVMVRQGSNDDNKAAVNYFCFDSHDEHLTVHNLPHVRTAENGKKITIDSYQDARKEFIALSQKYSEIHFYSQREDGAYRKMLGNFGISSENWNQLIRQLISGEDSFADLLEKTRTSDTLLDKYMIPMISSHLDEIAGTRSSIRENADHVIRESAQQKHSLSLRDAVSDYLNGTDEVMQHLQQMKETASQREHDLENIAAFHKSLQEYYSSCLARQQETEEQQKALQEKEYRIHQEKASEQWYLKNDSFQTACMQEKQFREKYDASKLRLENIKEQIRLAEAVSIFHEMEKLSHTISGLEEKRKQTSESEQARQNAVLRFSLKKAYEKELQRLDAADAQLKTDWKENQQKLQQVEQALNASDQKKQAAVKKQALLSAQLQNMQKEEKALFEKLNLGFALGRGFTGELVKEDIQQAEKILQGREKVLKDKDNALQKEKKKKEERFSAAAEEIVSAQEKREKLKERLGRDKNQLEELQSLQEKMLSFFHKYDISEQLLFDKERTDTLKKEAEDYRIKLERTQYDLRVLNNLIAAVRNGNAYLPQDFTDLLEKEGIHYETGQEFLKNRDDGEKMLEQKPLLPYGILLDQADYRKLQEIRLADFFLDRMIPVFLYDDLKNSDHSEKNGMILSEGSQKYFAYAETRLLSQKTEDTFLQQKQKQVEETAKLAGSYQECIRDFEDAIRVSERFVYEKDAGEKLKKQIDDAMAGIEMQEETITSLQKEQSQLPDQLSLLTSQIKDNELQLQKAQEQTEDFLQYVKNDAGYVKAVSAVDEIGNAIQQIERKAAELKQQKKEESAKRDFLHDAMRDRSAERSSLEKDASPFRNAEETEIREGSIEALREEYRIVSESLNKDEAEYQSRLDQAQRELSVQSENWKKTGITEEACRSHVYDPKEKEILTAQENDESMHADKLGEALNEAGKKTAGEEAYLKTAENELKQYGLEQPLPKEEISGDFDLRLKKLLQEKKTLDEQNKLLDKKINSAQQAEYRIENADLPECSTSKTLDLQENLNDQIRELMSVYRTSKGNVKNALEFFKLDYQQRRKAFLKRDSYFERVFDSDLSGLNEERFTLKNAENLIFTQQIKTETLRKKLDQLNADLQSFDHDQRELYRQIYGRTRALSQALASVSNRSRVRVEGRSTPQRLLAIEQPEVDEHAEERINEYLKKSFYELSGMINEKPADYEKRMDVLLNERNLLNVYLNTEKIRIKVYKFEKIASSSGLMEWDRACRSNSGGEHSLSCFIVIASMMAYIRNDQSEFEEGGRIRHYETIICDNPFASVSSEHLVRPLIQIVNTLNIQLITFTHITSASIANSFDVVIQLRNVSHTGNVVRMTVESESVSDEAVSMESAVLYRQSVQESLF